MFGGPGQHTDAVVWLQRKPSLPNGPGAYHDGSRGSARGRGRGGDQAASELLQHPRHAETEGNERAPKTRGERAASKRPWSCRRCGLAIVGMEVYTNDC